MSRRTERTCEYETVRPPCGPAMEDPADPADVLNELGRDGWEFVDRGFYPLGQFFAAARADVAGQAVGVAHGALEEAVDDANEREQFGRKIREFRAIAHEVAEMATEVEAARSLGLPRRRRPGVP